ncbi:MFS superfamily [Lentinula guzmanii]|uniref:MFS superfamily n=1 Tax=Lentinula guzmanii TaxID=2804957 RepID=A0AA38JCN2_9AGAR|nr:MFS superfamily [Lentinula guzmanii]
MRDKNELQEEDANQQATAISPEQDPTLLEKKWPTTDFGLIPIPERLQYHPNKPPFHFGLLLNASFGFASTFVVANLYYCQPLLIQLSQSFNVSYDEISKVPTLVQAGYAAGLLLISPLGDLVRRRQLILLIVLLSTTLSIPLAVTSSLTIFLTFSFLVGFVSVTPQVLLPLAADLAPAHKRASALSVVFAGLLFGVLIARVFAGIIAQFTSWRVVYFLAIGLQAVVLLGSWALLPDYPAKNQGTGMTYQKILWTMGKYAVTEPVLIQACLVNMGSSASFSAFWVTLTFLLGGDPYNYSTLVIGLFGLVGMFGVAMGPFVGKAIDALPAYHASLVACIALIIFQVVQVIGNGISIAAVIIAVLGLDIFRQMLQTSLASNIFSIAPEARARLNAVYILSLFIGQVTGTSAGTYVFIHYGWRACALMTLGFAVWQIVLLLARGPGLDRSDSVRGKRWIGWNGTGLERSRKTQKLSDVEEKDGRSGNQTPQVEGVDTKTHSNSER